MTRASKYCMTMRSVAIGAFAAVSAAAFNTSALAQSSGYNPQQGAPTRYQPPHTGILNGKFWTDTRYRYEYVDQANLPKDAHASTIRNKTGIESGFFHGFRAGVEGEFVLDVGPEDFNNTINGKTQYPVVADVNRRRSIRPISVNNANHHASQRDLSLCLYRQREPHLQRPSSVGNIQSNVHLMHAESKELSIGKLTAYTYLMDLYDLDQFSTSRGGFKAQAAADRKHRLHHYRRKYAHQTSYADTPVDYDADYVRVEQGLSKGGLTGTLVYELLY